MNLSLGTFIRSHNLILCITVSKRAALKKGRPTAGSISLRLTEFRSCNLEFLINLIYDLRIHFFFYLANRQNNLNIGKWYGCPQHREGGTVKCLHSKYRPKWSGARRTEGKAKDTTRSGRPGEALLATLCGKWFERPSKDLGIQGSVCL